MFDLKKILNQIRCNEINSLDLRNEFCPDYSQNPQITRLKLSDNNPNEWFNITALADKYFASSKDENIYIWNIELNKCIHILQNNSRVQQLLTLPDGRMVSVHEDRTIRLWNPILGEDLGIMLEQPGYINKIISLPYNSIVIGGQDGFLKIWHIDSRQFIMPFMHGNNSDVKYMSSYQESYIVSIDCLNNLIVWYVDANEKHMCLQIDFGDIMSFLIDYKGHILFGNTEGYIYRIKPTYELNSTCYSIYEDIVRILDGSVFQLKNLPDGKVLALTSKQKLYYLDQLNNSILNEFECKEISWPHSIDILADGKIVISGKNGEINLLSFPSRTIISAELIPVLSELKHNNSVTTLNLTNVHLHNDTIPIFGDLLDKRKDIHVIGADNFANN